MQEKKVKEINRSKRNMRRGATSTNKVKQFKEVPLYRTSGNVTMAQTAQYKFPNPFGAKQIQFNGIAFNSSGPIRVMVNAIAHLAPSYYFTPQTSTSVGLSGPRQRIIQSHTWFLFNDGGNTGRARSGETTICNIDWPSSSDIVVRAEVVDYTADFFIVDVQLASGWSLRGNFVCS